MQISDGEIAQKVAQLFDLRPADRCNLKLREPIYSETAAYGHFWRENKVVTKWFTPSVKHRTQKGVERELFTWEKLDCVEKIRKSFGL